MTNRRRVDERCSRAAALCLLALAAVLFQVPEARAQWTQPDANTVSTTNNVGVGTAAPAARLEVKGATSDATAAAVRVKSATDASLFFVRNDGKVGIGTNSPGELLNLAAAPSGPQMRFGVDAGASLMQFWKDSTPTTAAAVGLQKPGDPLSDDLVLSTYSMASGWWARLTVKNNGNVGIGTSSPAFKLDVVGSVRATGLCLAGSCKSSWEEVGGQWSGNGSGISYGGGNVGVGTANPAYGRLQVNKSVRIDDDSGGAAGSDVMGGAPNLYLGTTGGGGQLQYNAGGGLDLWQYAGGWGRTVTFARTGKVGIGVVNPQVKLDVDGDIRATGSVSATYQDVAEWVPSVQKLSAGTVVVLDAARANHVVASSTAYDTKVAGVVSDSPGVILGVGGEGKLKVATTGRVRVRVDASRGAIRIGDLLVTSGAVGAAMRSEPVNLGGREFHAPGTIIGKALEPLEKGVGEILVLLSLQ